MLILETPRVRLRNWREEDRDLFRLINSDPEVMEFFPKRRSPEESDALFAVVIDRIDRTGFGFYCIADRDSDQPLGFCGLAHADLDEQFGEDAIEVGWRLARPYWGKGLVTEAGKALLAYGFEERGLEEIVSFAVKGNTRSRAVMERIGLRHAPHRDFDHPRIPDDMPHLKPHVTYALDRAGFEQMRA